MTPAWRRALRDAEALITTWDSPRFFPEELVNWAPRLGLIAHCGGTVKTRFAPSLFDRLVITNAPQPMARHVAELAVTFLLYLARDVDRYREQLRHPSSAIYRQLHLSGGGEQTILGGEVGMIGFGRIGRAILQGCPLMPTLLVKNIDHLATFDDARRELTDGALLVRDNVIAAVGTTAELAKLAGKPAYVVLNAMPPRASQVLADAREA